LSDDSSFSVDFLPDSGEDFWARFNQPVSAIIYGKKNETVAAIIYGKRNELGYV
jgi:hypothetical protein